MDKPNRSAKVISFPAARNALYSVIADREDNVIGRKLLEFRKREGIVISDLCDRLNALGLKVTRSTVYRWESGEIIPNAYQLVAVCMALNLEDDISGFCSAPRAARLSEEGTRRLQQYRADLIATGKYMPKPIQEDTIEYIDMPVSYLAVSAGTGEFLSEGNFEMVSFPKASVPAGADFGVRVNGDSMEPVYHNGQIVWVQETPDVAAGEEGIFIYDGCGYIKLLQEREPDQSAAEQYIDSQGVLHKQPILVSYNKMYSPIVVPPEASLQIVGRVL